MTPLECEIIVGSIPAGAISRKGGSIWGMSVNTFLRIVDRSKRKEWPFSFAHFQGPLCPVGLVRCSLPVARAIGVDRHGQPPLSPRGRCCMDVAARVQTDALGPGRQSASRWVTLACDFALGALTCVSPNPPKDTDGRREDSGRGWVRELQGRWPGVLG